jgi:hypothetical protein
MKKYKINYWYNHPRMGFSNSITVTAKTVDEAIEVAKKEVKETYGETNFERFSFKPCPIYCGVVVR